MGKLPQRKIFYPYFLENFWKFPKLLFTVLTRPTKGAEIRRLGWGQKQIFESGEKLFFALQKTWEI